MIRNMDEHTNNFLKNVFTLSSGRLIAQVITFAIYPLLTRTYSPEAFGVWTVLNGAVVILTPFSMAGLEKAILLPKEDKKAESLFKLAVFLIFGWTLLSTLLILSPLKELSFIKKTGIESYLYWFPFLLFINSTTMLIFQWGNRKKGYNILSGGRIGTSILVSVGSFILHRFDSIGGVLYGNIIGRVPILSFWVWKLSLVKRFLRSRVSLTIIKEYIDVLKFGFISSTLSTISQHAPSLVLAYYWGPRVAGFFMLVDKVLSVPAEFLGESVYYVYFQDGAKSDGIENLWKKTKKIALFLIGISIIPALIMLFFGEIIFSFTFGSDWSEAGVYAQILICLYLVNLIIRPIMPFFWIIRKIKFDAVLSLISAVFQVGGLLMGSRYGITTGLIAMCVAGIFAQIIVVIVAIITYSKLKKHCGQGKLS